MDPFVEQLKRLCTAHPTRAKWVCVPAYAIGRMIGDRLAREGTDWANLRFVTPLGIALQMGAPFLVERGVDPSEDGLGPALIMRLLLALDRQEAPASPKLGDLSMGETIDGAEPRRGYFRPLAHQPQMAIALWSTLRELRMAGVRAADLSSDAFVSPDKHAEMRALLGAYENVLATQSRGDLATVFEEALRHPDWCPIQAEDCWTGLPDTIWSPLERRLMDIWPGERVLPTAFALPGASVPRRLHDAAVTRRTPEPHALLAFLMAPERAVATQVQRPRQLSLFATSGDDGFSRVQGAPLARARTVAGDSAHAGEAAPDLAEGSESLSLPRRSIGLFHAGGPEAEIEEVFRRLLASGRTLDQAEIVCASPQYATLIWEKAIRHDWPVTVAQGLPAALTRPGRALLSMVEWIEDDFAAGRLRRLLQSGDVRMGAAVSISTGQAARMIVKSQAAWGRDTYRLALGRYATSARTRAQRDDLPVDQREGLEARARQADELGSWIGAVISSVPVPADNRQIDFQEVVTFAHTFVDRFTARAGALDAFAALSLAAAIDELRALGDFRCPLDQALRFLRERVEGAHVGADRARPGHLHVSSLTSAAFGGRALIFVVGLEEGRVFPASFEDPILLDAERRRISPALACASDRTDEAVYAALQRLAAMSADPAVSITLSYSCRDVREYRPTYASWLLLQAYRVTSLNPVATYQDLHTHLGAPTSCVPVSAADALDRSRWWLHGVAKAGERSRPAVLRAFPSLDAGLAARAARDSPEFTEFDGHVPAAGVALDPCTAGLVVSPTQLEGAAQCPFRHFLKRGLGVDAIESGERDRDVWLDPMLRGSLLHDLYAQLLKRCRAENRRAELPADHLWLQQRGQARLEGLAAEMPPPSDEVRDRETRLFLDDLRLFAEAEAALDPSRTPVGFEVSFGRAEGIDDEPLAQAAPVVIDVGGGLTLRVGGRIDRIDRVGPSSYEIVDYKTGGYWPDDWKGAFAGGTRLQHALYGLAALELLKRQDTKATVAGAEYYFTSAKGQQERKRIPAPTRATINAVLTDLRAVISAGLFVHAHEPSACKWCDFGYACGQNAAARAEGKRGASNLAPVIKLEAYE